MLEVLSFDTTWKSTIDETIKIVDTGSSRLISSGEVHVGRLDLEPLGCG
jgi:hypothetical protein